MDVEEAKMWLAKPLWGGKTVTLGELIGLIIAGLIIWKHFLGKWSLLVGLAIILIVMILW